MIHYKISKNAKILFVGINPHPGSYRRGIPFSNNKMFWYLLNRSGLILENVGDLKKDHLLSQIYDKKFISLYNLNFVNFIYHPTKSISELKKDERKVGVNRVAMGIKRYKPKVVCFIGKTTYAKFIGHTNFDFGWQKDLFYSKVYVMHFPIRGMASVRVQELQRIKEATES
jgi:TDG/mug DNA glycosylase family protein